MTERNIDGLDQLLELEEKVSRTIEVLRSTTAQNQELQRENARLQQESKSQAEAIEKLENLLGRLEKERDTVRQRVQRLLDQVESLAGEKTLA